MWSAVEEVQLLKIRVFWRPWIFRARGFWSQGLLRQLQLYLWWLIYFELCREWMLYFISGRKKYWQKIRTWNSKTFEHAWAFFGIVCDWLPAAAWEQSLLTQLRWNTPLQKFMITQGKPGLPWVIFHVESTIDYLLAFHWLSENSKPRVFLADYFCIPPTLMSIPWGNPGLPWVIAEFCRISSKTLGISNSRVYPGYLKLYAYVLK